MSKLVIEYLDLSKPPEFTPEELKMLDELDKYPIVYDEDCPPLTDEQIARIKASYSKGPVCDEDCPPSTPAQFRRVNPRPAQSAARQ